MKTDVVLDVAPLPESAFGARTLTWWGTLGFMSLEGMGFALAIGAYIYLRVLQPSWPMNEPQPDLLPGTVVTLILLISVIPNWLLDHWAPTYDLKKVRLGLIVMSLFGIAPLIGRILEFPAMHVRWDADAYGSIAWFLLGLHTLHLITDLGDTLVLTVLMFTAHAENPRRFSDVSDNAFYWYFVVLSWLPIYFVIYWLPRL